MNFVIIYLIAVVFGKPKSRIVGGYEVFPPFKYPWLVAIYHDGESICGGILLTRTSLVTAAHCSVFSLEGYEVAHHRHNLSLTSEQESGTIYKVKKVIINLINIPETNMNDIAVWHLEKPIVGDIGRIFLDDGSVADAHGTLVMSAGWGWTKKGGPNSDVLREIEIPLVSYYNCYKAWKPYGYPVTEYSHVCAAGEGDKDTCKGDSGGPLFIQKNGKTILIGTTTFGYPCAHFDFPTIWTRTASFRYFLKRHVIEP